MKLYNTLTKSIENITATDNHVRIYSCGPTVYDRAHIGNLASFIYADLLHRSLRSTGNAVTHVMNLTDIDDKTIARSQQEYADLEPMAALSKLTRHYESLFFEDLKKVGVDSNSITFIRATEFIPQMQTLIGQLLDAGIGYIADDGIYFSIEAYRKTGKTYGQLVEITASSTGSARVNNDEYDKDNIHDFALWKRQKPGEPAWDFEIDGQNMTGRPGWHIECSAMSQAVLGTPFDIHTGGIDLKFPHHENEIAQSTGATETDIFARVFMHSEHILVEGKKMSKSLNNFLTLDDIEAANIDPLAFRLLVLEGHYRNQRNYSRESLRAAANRLKHWKQLAATVRHLDTSTVSDTTRSDTEEVLAKISSDLNSPEALREVDILFSQLSASDKNDLPKLLTLVELVHDLFGIELIDRDESVDALVTQREEARAAKDWNRADGIRDKLESQGIAINDTAAGPAWYRT